MDLKRIGQFCKRAKTVRIVLHPNSGALWVGNGTGMWLADDGVEINRENCGALLDIDTGDMAVTEGDSADDIYDGNRNLPDEDEAEVLGCGVMEGKAYIALNRGGECRVALCPLDYAKAATKEDTYRRYFLIGKEDFPVIAITDGVMLKMLVARLETEKAEEFLAMARRIGSLDSYQDDGPATQTKMDMQEAGE